MSAILPFEQIFPRDAGRVGGKAWRLARMLADGLPVPPGFCILPEALDPFDDEAIVRSYAALGGGRVAVRSSANVEDAEAESFAGQFESVIDVEGDAAVLEAVRHCRDSQRSARVAAYRRAVGGVQVPKLAVVVQRHVNLRVAGVLFTTDPRDLAAMLIQVAGEQIRIDRATDIASQSDALTLAETQALAALGRRIEALFECACDIEWGIADETIWILQARPITGAGLLEADRRDEIEHARRLAGAEHVTWFADDLTASLPAPTPMTWALVQIMVSRGMSGMYRELGSTPDAIAANLGAYDLIAGRPYLNRNRAQRVQFGDLSLGGWRGLLRFPVMLWRLRKRNRRIRDEVRSFAERFRATIMPQFVAECHAERAVDYTAIATPELLERFRRWCDRVLVEFARQSLKPAALANFLFEDWCRSAGAPKYTGQFAAGLLAEFSLNSETDLTSALRAMSNGVLDRVEFVRRFGHRGSGEMELAHERYSERPPAANRTRRAAADRPRENRVVVTTPTIERLNEYASLREVARDALMRGTAQLRFLLLELDRRLSLNGGVFFLAPDELSRAAAGENLAAVITERRRRWRRLQALPMPAALLSDDLEAIGRPRPTPSDVDTLQGLALSPGVATAPAFVADDPTVAPPDEPYILVCTSSDPAWTPLMIGARAVVFESAGVLSHGAIVARELGLPAVGAIESATQRIANGRPITVDGGAGIVVIERRGPEDSAAPSAGPGRAEPPVGK